MLLDELGVALRAVGADADDDCASGVKVVLGYRELQGLHGASLGVVLGVEVEHHPFPSVILEADLPLLGVR